MPELIRSAIGRKISFAISRTASPGVQWLARLLVVLLVEAPDQLLEDRAHAVVIEAGMLDRAVGVVHRSRAQVYVGRGELLDQRAQGVGAGQTRDLVAELESLSRMSCTLGENPSSQA